MQRIISKREKKRERKYWSRIKKFHYMSAETPNEQLPDALPIKYFNEMALELEIPLKYKDYKGVKIQFVSSFVIDEDVHQAYVSDGKNTCLMKMRRNLMSVEGIDFGDCFILDSFRCGFHHRHSWDGGHPFVVVVQLPMIPLPPHSVTFSMPIFYLPYLIWECVHLESELEFNCPDCVQTKKKGSSALIQMLEV
uniref:Uncharacterized protein n=1 Tax=Panagrolaimus sp. JU765 TaxID=591449 RepID=A0AC34QMV5_9BILA